MGMHTNFSALAQHRACPQQWAYRTIGRLEPAERMSPALEVGQWWHALRAADSIQRGRERGTLMSHPERLRATDGHPSIPVTHEFGPDHVLDAAAAWWDTLPGDRRDAWEAEMGATVLARLEYMDERWREEWAEALMRESPIAVEVRWERALTDGVTLQGVVDEVYRDDRRNMTVVRDHKSHKTLATMTALDDLLDSQLQIYAWGIQPLLAGWAVPQVQALSFDRVRSVAPKQPKLTITGGLSKAVTDYDLHTYLTWVGEGQVFRGRKADGSDGGSYLSDPLVVSRLSDPAARSAWFQRTLTPLNQNIIRAHLLAARDTAGDMGRTMVAESPGRNFGRACRWCDYASLCRAELVGGSDGVYPPEDHGLRVRSPRGASSQSPGTLE